MTCVSRRARSRRLLLLLVVALGLAAPSPASGQATLPPNDDFANAADLGGGMTARASGSNLWATAEAGEPAHDGGFAKTSVWYRWTAPRSGAVRAETCGSTFDTVLAVYRGGALDALGRVATNDDACDTQSAVGFLAVAGTTYWIVVDGFEHAQGSVELRLRGLTPPPNDDFSAARDLGNRSTASASGTNLDASIEPREPNHAGAQALTSVWYRWTAPASRNMQIDTCGSDFDTELAVYVRPTLGSLFAIAGNDDACRTQSRVRFEVRAGTTYSIAIDGFEQEQGSIRLALQPTNQVRFAGLRRDEAQGTAELVVAVPNPGALRLARSAVVAGASATLRAAGRVALAIRPRGRARRLLDERGRARLVARVTFTPAGGRPGTATRRVTLVQRP
jgi:hypothetical protein